MGSSVKKPRSAEMHPGPGFRVCPSIRRPDPKYVRAFSDFPTPDISDRMNRLYTMNPSIRCLTAPVLPIRGPACTVKVFPGDNLMVHKSLDVAAPGDIVVVDAGGSSMNAVLGDLVAAKARHRGIAAFVVDGYVRDLPGLQNVGLPVYARGVTPIGPLHRGPGEVNFAIQCGGIVVHPGDVIVGDANGVVVVPREMAATLIQRLRRQRAVETAYVDAVMRGEFSNEWVDDVLDAAGCTTPSRPGRPAAAPAPVSLEKNAASSGGRSA